MGIELNVTADNGAQLTYGRLTELVVDYQTKETKAILGGYSDAIARQMGQTPVTVLTAEYVMPDPPPHDLVSFSYAKLVEQNPEVDFTEV
jgi:hypothetical protein